MGVKSQTYVHIINETIAPYKKTNKSDFYKILEEYKTYAGRHLLFF